MAQNYPRKIEYEIDETCDNAYGEPFTRGRYRDFTFRCGHQNDECIAGLGVGLEAKARIITRYAQLERNRDCDACNQRELDWLEAEAHRRLPPY